MNNRKFSQKMVVYSYKQHKNRVLLRIF